ncbi:hypothetical protein [Jatrophihabitans sp.]|jgi:hypothetical protein|uniref:hypothetical protein n=1 Tax=Jatrophihabitans sp. TaxID=1932789 RepID=UPI002F10A920
MTAESNGIKEPNMFQLSGRGVSVSLALTGLTGQPTLTYQDSHHALSFSGDQDITVEDSALGQLVSVTLVKSIDAGHTSFSVLIPRLNILAGYNHVETLGITAVHSTSLAGIGHGQLTTYHVIHLHGTASQIQP